MPFHIQLTTIPTWDPPPITPSMTQTLDIYPTTILLSSSFNAKGNVFVEDAEVVSQNLEISSFVDELIMLYSQCYLAKILLEGVRLPHGFDVNTLRETSPSHDTKTSQAPSTPQHNATPTSSSTTTQSATKMINATFSFGAPTTSQSMPQSMHKCLKLCHTLLDQQFPHPMLWGRLHLIILQEEK